MVRRHTAFVAVCRFYIVFLIAFKNERERDFCERSRNPFLRDKKITNTCVVGLAVKWEMLYNRTVSGQFLDSATGVHENGGE